MNVKVIDTQQYAAVCLAITLPVVITRFVCNFGRKILGRTENFWTDGRKLLGRRDRKLWDGRTESFRTEGWKIFSRMDETFSGGRRIFGRTVMDRRKSFSRMDGKYSPVQVTVDGKMHVGCWMQQVTAIVGAVTCWIQQVTTIVGAATS